TFTNIEGVGWLEGSEFDDFLADAGTVSFAPIFGRGGNDHIVARSGATGSLFGGDGNDLIDARVRLSGAIFGGNGDDTILGGYRSVGEDGNDTITGGTILVGGRGNDTLDGGDGYDYAEYSGNYADYTITYDSGTDSYLVVDGVANRDGQDTVKRIEALRFADGLAAPNAGADNVLQGTFQYETLIGGPGSDTMSGGPGDDVYLVDRSGDLVLEAAGDGTDEVRVGFATAGTYTLTANVENGIIADATDGVNLVGNALANILTGNAAGNVLEGAAGNDTLRGMGGTDVIDGGADADTVVLLGARSSYSITRPNGADTVLTRSGETVTVRNVEFLQFTDGVRTIGGLDSTSGVDVLNGTPGDDTLDG
ncbi:MAG: calcium-binding protein, partial [Burkholderiales bacterium]